MKWITITILFIMPLFIYSQSNVPGTIVMKDGNKISVHHLGHLRCGGDVTNQPYRHSLNIVGDYNGQSITIDKFDNIRKIELSGFSSKDSRRVERANLKIYKKDGNEIALSNALIRNTCYGGGDNSDELRVIIMNPVTDELDQSKVKTRLIKSINF